ncbi:HipA domain-containing protein [bacterium]|nr:HipA domain-containing protein [bacterium]
MSKVCRICLENTRGESDYHARCLRGLFGTAKVPHLDIELGKLHTAALAMVGHTSLSGIQKKISVGLSADRETLQVEAEGGRYILKPQTETYPFLPENEHLTTQLAKLVGIEVAPSGLVSLKDGSLAYVVRRFDRLPDGRKLRQEDFCQIAEKSPKEKYDGSAELCVRLIRKYATEPLVEIFKLYRLMLFIWWSGNGDMHLKNFSLLTSEDGVIQLTPAYDLVCTRLVIPDDQLALPIAGKRDRLDRADWLEFARYCNLPEKPVMRVVSELVGSQTKATELIDRSFVSSDKRKEFVNLIVERTAAMQ